jgi:tetratricopeptide (TPR) repeat protein
MKLVEGQTLAALLRRCGDAPQDRARLLGTFEQVCQAVAYAHGKGIIHRDLKPANVMVGAFGEVQVMDWGFAKILPTGAAEANGHHDFRTTGKEAWPPYSDAQSGATHSGALMGTPAYMSPEQARGDAELIDPRADVFALGAILCEILTDRPPYGGGSADAICRKASLGDLDDARARLDASGTDGALRELAKRCLAADRTARPADAGEVARDVTAYLASTQDRLRRAEVAQASAEARATADRRARRFAIGLATALLVGTAVAGWQTAVAYGAKHDALDAAVAQEQAKVTAQRKEAEARSVQTFFRERVLEAVRPKDDEGGLGKDATIRQALDAAEPEIAMALAGQPVAEADIRHTMGLSYWHLGEYDRALRQNRLALELQRRFLGPEHPETLGTMNNLGLVLFVMGQWEAARQVYEETLQLQRQVLGAEHPDTLTSMHNLANALTRLRRLDEAYKLYDETLELQRRVLGPEHRHTLHTVGAKASLLIEQGKLEESRKLFEETLQLRRRTLGPEHPDTLASMNGLASVLYNLDRKEEARKVYEETLNLQRRVLGREHPTTLATMYNLANTLSWLDRNDDATTLYRETLELQKRVLDPEHFKTLRTMSALSEVLRAEGRLEEARPLSEESLRLRKKVLGPEHPETLISMHGLAMVMYDHGQIGEARNLFEQTVALRRKVLKPGHGQTLQSENALAWLLATAPDVVPRSAPRRRTSEGTRRTRPQGWGEMDDVGRGPLPGRRVGGCGTGARPVRIADPRRASLGQRPHPGNGPLAIGPKGGGPPVARHGDRSNGEVQIE